MQISVLSRHEMKIAAEDDVVLIRRHVRSTAQQQAFDAFAAAAITTATSELTRNVWVHAKGGKAIIEVITDGVRNAIRVKFEDQGPGIPDVDRVMRGGYSTAKSLGLGLSGSKRLVDDFAIESVVGKGTAITFVKWKPY